MYCGNNGAGKPIPHYLDKNLENTDLWRYSGMREKLQKFKFPEGNFQYVTEAQTNKKSLNKAEIVRTSPAPTHTKGNILQG